MLRFTKMQGLGNDYVYLDCTQREPDDLPGLAVRISNRNFGVGSDGLICICGSEKADFSMRMFNADGSEGKMCGNGIRCVGKFVYDKKLTEKTELTIETRSGIRTLALEVADGVVQAATVDMGTPLVEPEQKISVKGKDYTGTPVSMGNPHFVVFCEEVESLPLAEIGPGFEKHEQFPDRVNTEFVQLKAGNTLRMRVWERGSGETLACGTGACAVAAAACSAGLTGNEVTVELDGGALKIRLDRESGHIFMTGPAVTVFEGELGSI